MGLITINRRGRLFTRRRKNVYKSHTKKEMTPYYNYNLHKNNRLVGIMNTSILLCLFMFLYFFFTIAFRTFSK